MTLRNTLWMIKFLIKKKRCWFLIIIAAVYLVLAPYQNNLLIYFGNPEMAEILFWKSAYLYHNVFVLIFVFQTAIQLLNTEISELYMMWRKQIFLILCSMFFVYQVLASPEYIWYASIYPGSLSSIIILILIQIINITIFYVLSVVSHKTIFGFIIVFAVILLIFGQW